MVSAKGQIDQRNKTESPEKDPQKYSQMIFDKESKALKWRKDSQQVMLEKLDILM